MLKYLNEERTLVRFGDSTFFLDSPGNWASISDASIKFRVLTYLEIGGEPTPYGLDVDLDALKAKKNEEINQARLKANRSTFMFMGKAIACDELSRGDIEGTNGIIGNIGDLPPGWPGAWKAADNSYVPIPSVAAWKAFYGSMYAQGMTNFAKAQTLKQQLSIATTKEQIDAIVW